MSFLNKDYFLTNQTAQQIYHEEVAELPIVDFHTHLPEKEIADDKQFSDLWELWLACDHYKWRLMRACGIAEDYITGKATPYEKFEKFSQCLPLAIQNPVSHWAHLELQRIFSIDLLLIQANAKEIWEETRQQLKNNSNLSVRNILKKFRVETVCTTDDPSSDLLIHQKMAQDSQATTQVLPTFRPDNAFKINDPSALKAWLKTLSDQPIKTLTDLFEYLTQRHQYFHETGCRLSDHGMAFCPQSAPDLKRAEKTFEQALNNQAISREENDTYQATILHHIAQLNTEKSWTMQLHLGSIRNNSRRYFKGIGVDSGFDSMGNWQQTNRLIAFLSQLEANNILPKIVVYNLNPNESESICCALQSFQTNAATPGSIQYGAAWWHLDHKRGMNNQLEILSSLGVLGTFVGMLTDSRSFTSCVRHEYFRRLLCQFIGQGIENGEITDHPSTVDVVKNIAYYNAKNFFKF